MGPEAVRQLASCLAIRGNTDKSKMAADLYGGLSLTLVRGLVLVSS